MRSDDKGLQEKRWKHQGPADDRSVKMKSKKSEHESKRTLRSGNLTPQKKKNGYQTAR